MVPSHTESLSRAADGRRDRVRAERNRGSMSLGGRSRSGFALVVAILGCCSMVRAAERLDHRVLAVRGVESDVLPIARPTLVSGRTEPGYLIYSAAECRVHIVDENLETQTVFGQCGEGPGDLSGVEALTIVDGEAWAVMRTRISVHTLRGDYVRDILYAERPIHRPLVFDRVLVGLAYPRFDEVLIFDPFAPSAARSLYTSPDRDNLVFAGRAGRSLYFYGSISGRFVRIDPDQGSGHAYDIGLSSAKVRTDRGSGEFSSWDNVVVRSWVHDETVAVVVVADNDLEAIARSMANEDAEASRWIVRLYDLDFGSYRLVEFDFGGWPLLTSFMIGSSTLVVCDTWGSRIAAVSFDPHLQSPESPLPIE